MRSPSGQPLKLHAVQVIAHAQWPDTAVVSDVMTDAAGHVQLPCDPGLRRLLVSVPGVGFGSTGTFELLPGKVASPEMPPLAPFAAVSGTIPASLVDSGARVHMDDYEFQDHKWYDPQAPVDAKGHFTLQNILPGEHRLTLFTIRGNAEAVNLTLDPGENVKDVVMSLRKVDAPPSTFTFGPKPGAPKPAVRGRVTDADGRPVAGADVYALCSYQGAIRQYQEVLPAKTGDGGAYVIPSLPVGEGSTAVSLVAFRAGSPIAQVTAQAPPGASASSAAPADFHADLILPNDHPGLTVRVRQNGKPLPDVLVRLTPETGTGLYDRFYVGAARGAASEAVARLLEPTIPTGADGEARFTDLTPGLWDITAVPVSKPEALDMVGRWQGGFPQTSPYNVSRGVTVAAGRLTTYALNLGPSPGEVAIRVWAPDGQPPATPTLGLEYGTASSSGGTGGFITLDKSGTGKYSFERSGLWDVAFRFRDTAQENYQDSTEPFYEGDALVAVSPALPRTGMVTVRSTRHGPGRIHVRVLDDTGHPARGAVWIGDAFDAAKYGASLDAQGAVIFPDMPSGQYLLRASFDKPSGPPTFGKEGEPFPTDARLTNVSVLVPQMVTVKSDEETLVTFRPQFQGYVRGKIVVAAPDSPKNYAVYFPYYSEQPPVFRYDAKTGDFIGGPFPPGKTTLHLQRITRDAVDSPAGGKDSPVDIEAGRVISINLTPAQSAPAPGSPTDAMLTMGGVFSRDRSHLLTGTVFLPDGKTPAWGARAALVVPDNWQPVQTAQTDATGRLSAGDSWYTFDTPTNPPPGSPTEPVIAAWLPGANGAVIQSDVPGQTPHLVLPAAVAMRGRVTVGGQPVDGLSSSFRVLAAYQGRGKLNALFSVEATAQADGTFELAGLTAGTYFVQAARDNIWLSQTQTLTVRDRPLPDLTLDIAPLGAIMRLHLTDEAGKPLANKPVHLERPSGPLTDVLWPSSFPTDAAGDLRLEGLESGTQAVSMQGHTTSFFVPAFVAGQPPTTKTLVVTTPVRNR